VVRINFSHGKADDHRQRVEMVRTVAKEEGRVVGILGDLQGPKIRVSNFIDGAVELVEGKAFTIDVALDENAGDINAVGCTYQELADDISVGSVLVLDDGRVVLKATEIDGSKIHTQVLVGGTLSNRKGINLRGGGLSAAAITEKDREDLRLAVELDIDYLGLWPRLNVLKPSTRSTKYWKRVMSLWWRAEISVLRSVIRSCPPCKKISSTKHAQQIK